MRFRQADRVAASLKVIHRRWCDTSPQNARVPGLMIAGDRQRGADGLVSAMKRGNARGANGAGHRRWIGSTGNGRNPIINGSGSLHAMARAG